MPIWQPQIQADTAFYIHSEFQSCFIVLHQSPTPNIPQCIWILLRKFSWEILLNERVQDEERWRAYFFVILSYKSSRWAASTRSSLKPALCVSTFSKGWKMFCWEELSWPRQLKDSASKSSLQISSGFKPTPAPSLPSSTSWNASCSAFISACSPLSALHFNSSSSQLCQLRLPAGGGSFLWHPPSPLRLFFPPHFLPSVLAAAFLLHLHDFNPLPFFFFFSILCGCNSICQTMTLLAKCSEDLLCPTAPNASPHHHRSQFDVLMM